MKRLTIIAMIVLLAGLVLSQDLFAGPVRLIEKEFKVKMGKKLELDIETGGSLDITGWDRNLVKVTVRIDGKDSDEVEIDFDESSSGLEIHTDYEGGGRSHRSDVDFEIMVPERFDISIDSNGGDIAIKNVDGKISGKTMGGDMELGKLKGKIGLTTMGGDITVKDSEIDGSVKTMGGDILIKDVVGDLKGSTMGGDVTYENVTAPSGESEGKEVKISTMGGDVNIDYPGRKVSATTYGGDIDVSQCEEVHVSTMGGDINVQEAPAGAEVKTMGGDIKIHRAGEYVKARTMGGDIEVNEIDGWVKATTMGGDVTVTMIGDPGKGRRDVQLKSMGGDIELEVPAGLSMKFDIELAYTKGSRCNYRIESDFDMNIEKTDKWERKWGSKRKYIYGTGEIKGGEHLIKIRTVNGNIIIRKGK